MVSINCHVCNSSKFKVFSTLGVYRIVICSECGLYYVNPIPRKEILDQFVTDADNITIDQLMNKYFCEKRAQILFNKLEKYIQPGTFLDVGCSTGITLTVGRERGWTGTGIELCGDR